MFSLFTSKATKDVANNAQAIELGKASKMTLGGEGMYPESIRASHWFVTFDQNSN